MLYDNCGMNPTTCWTALNFAKASSYRASLYSKQPKNTQKVSITSHRQKSLQQLMDSWTPIGDLNHIRNTWEGTTMKHYNHEAFTKWTLRIWCFTSTSIFNFVPGDSSNFKSLTLNYPQYLCWCRCPCRPEDIGRPDSLQRQGPLRRTWSLLAISTSEMNSYRCAPERRT